MARLDNYVRVKARVVAMDGWFESHPVIEGEAHTLRLHLSAISVSTKTLAALRAVIAEPAREDGRFDRALQALAAECRRVRESRE